MSQLHNYKEFIIKLDDDELVESPNEFSEFRVAYYHRDFWVPYPELSEIELYEAYREDPDNFDADKKLVPLYAHIHSGVSLSLSRGSDRWDTSFKGFVVAPKDATDEDVAAFVLEWNEYLQGSPAMYTIEDAYGDEIDSCGGYYTYERAKAAAIDVIEAVIARRAVPVLN